MDEQERKDEQRQENIKRSISREIERLKREDVMYKIDCAIKEVYNTTAVTALELVEQCATTFTVQIQSIYKECKYAVYMCMKSDWVKQSLQICLNKWDSSMQLKLYIAAFLKGHGATDADMNAQIRKLPSYLPVEYQNENSPFMYKAYKAVILLSDKGDIPNNLAQLVLGTDAYFKTIMECVRNQVPLIATCTLATHEAVVELKETAPYGYTVMLNYANMSTLNDAFIAALGNRHQSFFKRLQESQQQEKTEQLEKDIKKSQEPKTKVIVNDNPKRPTTSKPPVKKKQTVNVAPSIPIWFAATFIHIVVVLLLFIFTKFFAILSTLCLGASSVGWINKEHGTDIGGKSPILYIAGGYAGFAICVVLFLM